MSERKCQRKYTIRGGIYGKIGRAAQQLDDLKSHGPVLIEVKRFCKEDVPSENTMNVKIKAFSLQNFKRVIFNTK